MKLRTLTLRDILAALCAGLVFIGAGQAWAGETACRDGMDEDADGMTDCADSDCYDAAECQPDGEPENTDARCSDFVDNDSDGVFDCDDKACHGPRVSVCKGSFDAAPAAASTAAPMTSSDDYAAFDPEMAAGGESNLFTCSDGIDNDGDGKIDCEDIGCQLAQDVSYCKGSPELRFGVVGTLEGTHEWGTLRQGTPEVEFADGVTDARFSKLQVRALGPIPGVSNSFFLMSMRMEKTPRLTFVTFEVPINDSLRFSLNSGSGSLSYNPIVSSSKQILLDPAYYLTSAFDQGNGGQMQLKGIEAPGLPGFQFLHYEIMTSAGTGRFAGNVGGGYVTDDTKNLTWNLGARAQIDHIGYSSVFDTKFIYRPLPLSLSTRYGVKWEQRSAERFPALFFGAQTRFSYFHLAGEYYWRNAMQSTVENGETIEISSKQHSMNVELGVLLLPKHLMLAMDYGFYKVMSPLDPSFSYPTDEETQLRGALHWYFWRQIGVASVFYARKQVRELGDVEWDVSNEFRIAAQYRF